MIGVVNVFANQQIKRDQINGMSDKFESFLSDKACLFLLRWTNIISQKNSSFAICFCIPQPTYVENSEVPLKF